MFNKKQWVRAEDVQTGTYITVGGTKYYIGFWGSDGGDRIFIGGVVGPWNEQQSVELEFKRGTLIQISKT